MSDTLPNGTALSASPRWRLELVVGVLATVVAALLVSYLTVEQPELLKLDFSLSLRDVVGIAAAFALSLLIFRYPTVGLVLLVLFVYLNLSQILERYHGLPSLLRLLVVPFALAIWLRRGGGAFADAARMGLSLLLAAYCAVLLASTTQAWSPGMADQRFVEILKAFTIYLLVVLLVTSARQLRVAVWTLLLAATVLAALGVYQVVSGDFEQIFGGFARFKQAQIYERLFKPRIAGPVGDPNFFAQILLMVVPFGLLLGLEERRRRVRGVAFAFAGVVIAGLVLTYSRSAALVLACIIGMTVLSRRHRVAEVVAAAVVAIVLLVALPTDFVRRLTTIEEFLPGERGTIDPDSSFQQRRLYVGVAWQMFLDRPLLGVGGGNYTVHFERYAERVGSAHRNYEDTAAYFPHNLFLEIAAETGVVGLAVFGLIMGVAVVQLRTAGRRFLSAGDRGTAATAKALELALAAYLLSGLFLHDEFPRYPWLLLGLTAALHRLGTGLEEAPAVTAPETAG